MKKKVFIIIKLLLGALIFASLILVIKNVFFNNDEGVKTNDDKDIIKKIISAGEDYYNSLEEYDESKNIYSLINVDNMPKNGELYLNESGDVALLVILNNKCYVKDFDSALKSFNKDSNKCVLNTLENESKEVKSKANTNIEVNKKSTTTTTNTTTEEVKPSLSYEINGEVGTNGWYKSSVKVTIHAKDYLKYKWCLGLNCEPVNEEYEDKTITITNTDEAQVCTIIIDKNNNSSTKIYSDIIKVDSTKPVVNITKEVEDNTIKLTSSIKPVESISGYIYSWYKDNKLIDKESNDSYIVSYSGTYKLVVTTKSGIKVESNEIKIDSSSVSYNLNGGSNTIEDTIKLEGVDTSITSTIPIRDGYTFLGWSTNKLAKEAMYQREDIYTNDEDITLYAIWKKTVNVNFISNGANLSSTLVSCDMYNNDEYCSITTPSITRDDYTIIGFNTNKDATNKLIEDGKRLNVSEDSTYYAITSNLVTVKFYRNNALYLTNKDEEASSSEYLVKTCKMYNEDTGCTITSPSITAPDNTPIVLGFDTTSTSTSSIWNPLTDKLVDRDYSFYAITKNNDITRTVTYNKNGGTGNMDVSTCTILATYNGEAQKSTCLLTLKENTYTKNGYSFKGWGTTPNSVSYDANTTYTAGSNVTLYAIWEYDGIKINKVDGSTHKGIIYLDPTNLDNECTIDNYSSSIGTKTGCMKWYVYEETNETYKLLLDHNTTARISWDNGNTNVAYENSNVKTEVYKLVSESKWVFTPRIISAYEIANITGNNSFDSNLQNGWFYFDSNNQILTREGVSKYAWLYDYTIACTGSGCSINDQNTYGYWTSTTVGNISTGKYIWAISHYGYLVGDYYASFNEVGVRPVIEISKDLVVNGTPIVYKNFDNGTAVYYNPETNTECNISDAVSRTGIKSGCMKWYAFNDSTSSKTVNLILDHNTTATVAWKLNGVNVALNTLATDTNTWNTTLNARLIEASEVALITGYTGWNDNPEWYFLDSNSMNPSVSGIGSSRYSWLFDYTKSCTTYGCNISDSSTSGYWTNTAHYSNLAWDIYLSGRLSAFNIDDSDYIGIRPVISVLKSKLS